MQELNISSYIQIMQPGLIEHDTQEGTANFLFDSINQQQYVYDHGYHEDVDSKRVTNIVKNGKPVPDGIKKASQIETVIREALKYFDETVVEDLNPHLKDDMLEKVAVLIREDKVISSSKRDYLLSLYRASKVGQFLGETFLYALNRDNKKSKDDNTVDYQDAPLLAEVNYECPISQEKLVVTVKGLPVKNYMITQIFPEGLSPEQEADFRAIYERPDDLDAPSNLIALSTKSSAQYLLSPSAEEYTNLYELKRKMAKSYQAKMAINRIELEDDIRTVLGALIDVSDDTELVELEYDALHVDEKFKPENFILKTETQLHILRYYRFIESTFSEAEADFDMIASEIKISSSKLEKSGMSQEEVIENLSEWIRNKAKLSTSDNSKLACKIVVSFFIQNCEVFHK